MVPTDIICPYLKKRLISTNKKEMQIYNISCKYRTKN